MPHRFVSPYLLRDKLTLSCALVLVLASIASSLLILGHLKSESRKSLVRQSQVLAEQAARRVTDLAEQSRWDDVADYIASFRNQPEILSVEVFHDDRKLVAGRYFGTLGSRSGRSDLDCVSINVPITVHGETKAFLFFSITTEHLQSTTFRTALFLFGVNVFCLFVAVASIYLMLQKISDPIASLVKTTKDVSRSRDFSLRAQKFKDDEIGQLADSFNQMLDTVENQAREIEKQAKQLARAERMESLGVLAGGVAHDLNNLLGPMVAMPSIMSERLDKNDPMRIDLSLIGESAGRAASVVQDLLSLARREKCNRRPMWLNPLVYECLESPAVSKITRSDTGIEVVANLDDSLPPIVGSASHLVQAILNVVINGIESMKGKGGQLQISTGVKSVADRTDLLIGCGMGDYVFLAIEDKGCGIPGDQLQRILEPFFSSKPMGASGSGLGLAVVYGILEDHEAGLKVESKVEEGTLFEIYFPISAELPKNEVEIELRGGTERVLVVDDVDAQRVLAERLLRSNGYTTATARNGRDAIERLKKEQFDAVVLDMIMEEEFDGLDTYREIRRITPATRCVIATGYSESVRVKEVLQLGASSCLRKPFSHLELCHAVRDALDQAPNREELELVS